MATLEQLQTWLTDAEQKYHQLLTGSKVEEVEHGDMRNRYTRADVGQLAAYIQSLKAQISAAGGTVAGLVNKAISIDL